MVKEKSVKHIIESSWCKGCGICVHFCPKNVLELNSVGKAWPARPGDCIGCRLCQFRCPDLAIEVLKEDSGNKQGEQL